MNEYLINEDSIYGSKISSHFGRIKIESPEQFVPLFLAQCSPKKVTDGTSRANYYFNQNGSPLGVKLKYRTRVDLNGNHKPNSAVFMDKEELTDIIRKDLQAYLNFPVPTEYALPVLLKPNEAEFSSDDYSNASCIAGHNITDYFMRDSLTDIAGLGFYATKPTQGSVVTLKTNLYQSSSLLITNPSDLHTHFLIIVKAKHLAVIRASMYLEIPWTVPVPDIKVLRTPSALSKRSIMMAWNDTLKSVVEGQGLEVVYTESVEMNKYLFNTPPAKNAKETLEVAQQLIKTPYPFVA